MASDIAEPPVDPDNPEWTEADFARSRPASALPAHLLAAFPETRNRGGRPAGSNKAQINLRIDRDVLEKFKAKGPGWQTRMNEALRRAEG